jgi:excisionase family DNA binding protein
VFYKRTVTSEDGNMSEQHLTPEELAERQNVPLGTIYVWNSKGVGPKYLRVGRHVRYRLADVVEWERSRMVEPAPSRTA